MATTTQTKTQERYGTWIYKIWKTTAIYDILPKECGLIKSKTESEARADADAIATKRGGHYYATISFLAGE